MELCSLLVRYVVFAGRWYDDEMHVVNIAPMTNADLDEVSALLRTCFNWLADLEGFTPAQRAFLTGERSSVQTVREESKTRPHLVARGDGGTLLGMSAIRGNELARLYVDPVFTASTWEQLSMRPRS
jgi:hypothetical protein